MSRVLVLLPPSGPASNTSTISASASVSVFVIELVAASHGRAEYKRCEAAPDPQQPDYAEFECGGERGEFVYIRLVFGQKTENRNIATSTLPRPQLANAG